MISAKIEPIMHETTDKNIFITSDYSKFNFFSENREIKSFHVKRLKQSIAEKNLLHCNPILVNKDFYILDGQNRFYAARELGVPIYYKFEDFLQLEDIIQMNITALKWGMEDYLHFHVQNQKPAYITLNRILKAHKYISLPVLLRLLCNHTRAQDEFKRGYFRFEKGTAEIEQLCAKMDMVIDFLKNKIVSQKGHEFIRSRTFAYGLSIFLNSDRVDVVVFMEQLNLQFKSLRPCTQYNYYVDLFLEIYNYKLKKNRIKREHLFEEKDGQEN